jgi:uncharacterized protein YcsI (UPF0317 family)
MKKLSAAELLELSPQRYRRLVRKGDWKKETFGICRGYALTDLIIVPKEYAYDCLAFCNLNRQALSVIDITEIGSPHPKNLAPDADIRTDLPRYIVYKDGKIVDEPTDIIKYWRDDLVGFLLGCSGSFDWALREANIQPRSNGVFSTKIACTSYGIFHGSIAVSCRIFKNSAEAVKAIQISSRHNRMHGPPIHIGDPAAIGIQDVSKPDLIHPWGGLTPTIPSKEEVALFWPCSATIRGVALKSKIPFMIVDHLRCMLVTNALAEELSIL